MQAQLIVFFDGTCGVCNGFVQFLLPRDACKVLRYAPLQGSSARQLLSVAQCESLASLVLYDDKHTYEKSTAVIRIVAALGGGYRLVYIFLGVPRFFRDYCYDFFAQRRKRFDLHCRLLTPQEKTLFFP